MDRIHIEQAVQDGIRLAAIGRWHEALDLLSTARERGRTISDAHIEAAALNGIADLYLSQGRYDLAHEHYDLALACATSSGNEPLQVEIYIGLGGIFHAKGEVEKAAEQYALARELVQKLEAPRLNANYSIGYGRHLFNLGQIEQAHMEFTTALSMAQSAGDKLLLAHAHNELGNILHRNGDLTGALEEARTALALAVDISNASLRATLKINISGIYYQMGKYDESFDELIDALSLAEDIGSDNLVSACHYSIAGHFDARGNHDEAAEHYRMAITLAEACGDLSLQANSYGALGRLYDRTGMRKEARSNLEYALELATTAQDVALQAVFYNDLTYVYYSDGHLDSVIEVLLKAIPFAEAAGDIATLGSCYNNLGVVYEELGRLEEGRSVLETAIRVTRDIGDPVQEAPCHNAMGTLLYRRGQLKEALEEYQYAAKLMDGIDNPISTAPYYRNIGRVYQAFGKLDSAYSYYERALALATKAGDPQLQGDYHLDVGRMHFQFGRLDEARLEFETALRLGEQLGAPMLQAECLAELGRLVIGERNEESAVRYYQRAVAIVEETPHDRYKANYRLGLGEVLIRSGQWHQGLAECEAALEIASRLNIPMLECQCRLGIGDAFLATGAEDEAVREFTTALGIAERASDADLLAAAQLRLAVCYEHSEPAQLRLAYQRYEAAINAIETVRSDLRQAADRQGFFGGRVDAYRGMVGLCLKLGSFALAFDYAERSRSRAFVDALASARTTLAQSVPEYELTRYRQLRGALDELLVRLRAQSDGTDRSVRGASAQTLLQSALLDKIKEAVTGINAEIHRLAAQYPEFGACETVVTPDLSAVVQYLRARAPSGTGIVSYYTVDLGVGVFVVTADGLQATRILPCDMNLVSELLFTETPVGMKYHMEINASHEPEYKLRLLRSMLLSPLEIDGLLSGISRLWIVPHGILHYVPWAALPHMDKEWEDGRPVYLVEEFEEIIVLPAAALLQFCDAQAARSSGITNRVFIVGNPDGSLLGARQEAEAIGQIYRDSICTVAFEGTTRQDVLLGSQECGIVHLAMHGIFERRWVNASGLELADGRLALLDIINDWRMNAYLVVLSSCYGADAMVLSGDEVLALTRGILHAGTASVVASLFAADDQYTATFMKLFHYNLRSGLGKGKALVQAQRACIEMGMPVRAWGAFQLYGHTSD